MTLFDPDKVNEVAQRHLGKPFEQMVADIGTDLKAIYPDDVSTDMPLVFNSAGGIMYQLKIFAMTPSEYIMICGSSIGSSGHSGRHPVTFWDTVLSGEARYMNEGRVERAVYKVGDRIFANRWQAQTIDFPDHCWMLEYARGTLTFLLPFGFANTASNTLDWVSAYRLIRVYVTLSLRHFRAHSDQLRPMLGIGSALLTLAVVLLSLGSQRRH